ncbi:MAG: hypothetical protein DMG53_04510 [Acidobacteria bacterium]|nr:MAG: hypothetical protein DMG53_04510 [Acidobacteriota bacterium]
MGKSIRAGVLVLSICASPLAVDAQVQQNSSDSSTVIRATTRLVQVDVVVTDSSGRPLKDRLSEKDFSIFEDGKPQKLSFFSFQQLEGQEKRQIPQPPQLPPHVATNRPEYQHPSGPPIILLLDGINTPAENQMVVRQQMLTFLADHFDPRMRIAVFLLGNELKVLQDFTSDPALLIAAMQKYRSQASAAGRQGGTDVQLQPPSFDGPNLPPQARGAAVGAGDSNSRSLMNIGYALARFEKESNANTMEMRIAHTADALAAIARHLAGFPGRKVVIWFSASFPLNLSVVDPQDFDVYRSYADRLRATTNLLSDAQIAIYPVDARGSIRDSSTFYQVGYYPSHKQWDGKFHTIKVKVAGSGLAVRHRRGYYAIDPESWRRSGSGEMKAALERDSLASTGVLFYARAMPPSGNADVKVEFLVDPHTITFETQSENQHECNLEFQVQAFTPDGKLVKAQVQQAEAPLKQDTYDRIQKSGLPMPVSIKLAPGQYLLHIGVRDNRTGQFGTSELPLSIAETPAH